MSSEDASPQRLDVSVLRRWAVLARAALDANRGAIDDLNVFPVPDADTGTNMFLTIDAAVGATLDPDHHDSPPLGQGAGAELERFARAALLGARGNSGVITSQLVRGLVEELRAHPDGADPRATAACFERASRAAYAAVTEPEEGTILTVADAAARSAREAADAGADLAGVVTSACDGGRAALASTTQQLEALSQAGVVDAGGAGLVVVLEALRRVVTGASDVDTPMARRSEAPEALVEPCHATRGYGGPRHEVMFVVDDGDDDAAEGVRTVLRGLGDSVLLVGAGTPTGPGRSGPWRGHVHTDEPDAVVAAVAALGTARDVVVTDLEPSPPAGPSQRDYGDRTVVEAAGPGTRLVVTATAPGLRRVAQDAAAVVLEDAPDRVTLVVDGTPTVLQAPTDAHLVAALAVYDPALPASDLADALADALAGVEGHVIAGVSELEEVRDAIREALRGAADAALVTVVLGAGAPRLVDELRPMLTELVAESAPSAETGVLDGGDTGYVLTIGIER